jgi:hypothetical protein
VGYTTESSTANTNASSWRRTTQRKETLGISAVGVNGTNHSALSCLRTQETLDRYAQEGEGNVW